MEITQIIKELEKILPKEDIKKNEPMRNHTSFKIGGPAEIFINIKTLEQIKSILKFTKQNQIELTIIGNGSNLLVTDKGIKGIVAKIDIKQINIQENEIIVGSGVTLGLLAQELLKKEISGFEELAGIPGTIGGAITMNAGAHDKEIKDIITEVKTIDYNGKIYTFTNEQCLFEYRKSRFLTEKHIIIQAKLKLNKGKREEIQAKMKEYLQYRKEKQPIEYSTAGSTFKRGKDFITAKLIDEAGLKGYKIGDAQISEKHAGFIINKGNATAKDVIKLSNYVKQKVFEKFGKNIELEIQIIGE